VRLHLGERITTRQAAQALHLEECYFCRLFHRLTKITFREYVAQARVEQAKTLLRKIHQSIGQIASDVGFQSATDFNRIFKARVGMTPTDFRRKGL
jgi:AraC-like DNA-binding protein